MKNRKTVVGMLLICLQLGGLAGHAYAEQAGTNGNTPLFGITEFNEIPFWEWFTRGSAGPIEKEPEETQFPDIEGEEHSLQFIDQNGNVLMDHEHIESAELTVDNTIYPQYLVKITFDEVGKELFAKITGDHVGEKIKIVFDNETISEPMILCQITEGEAMIDGLNSQEEAQRIVTYLNFGEEKNGKS